MHDSKRVLLARIFPKRVEKMNRRYTVIPATKESAPRIIELSERRAPKYRDVLPLTLPQDTPTQQEIEDLNATVFSRYRLCDLTNTHDNTRLTEALRHYIRSQNHAREDFQSR